MAKRFWNIPDGSIRIPIPNTSQNTDFSCGACSLLSICIYYGIGPEEECIVVRDSGMTSRGANPEHILKAAKKYGLCAKETQPMSVQQLRQTVNIGRPVICMLQAWGNRKSYANVWDYGHWVVAIGFDDQGIYFEDSSIDEARGYLSDTALNDRWHDYGKHNKRVPQYGMTVWHPTASPKEHNVTLARRIL